MKHDVDVIRTYRFVDSASVTHKVNLVRINKNYEVRVDNEVWERATDLKKAGEKYRATIKLLEDLKKIILENLTD